MQFIPFGFKLDGSSNGDIIESGRSDLKFVYDGSRYSFPVNKEINQHSILKTDIYSSAGFKFPSYPPGYWSDVFPTVRLNGDMSTFVNQIIDNITLYLEIGENSAWYSSHFFYDDITYEVFILMKDKTNDKYLFLTTRSCWLHVRGDIFPLGNGDRDRRLIIVDK